MALPFWIGNAAPTVDAFTGTVALTWAAADTATITHTESGKTLVVTIGTLVTTAQVATTIKQAWQSEAFTDTTASCVPAAGGTSIPEFAVITASVSSSVVTFVADTSGASIGTLTMSETTAGTGTFTAAHSVTATGPSWFTNTGNSSTGSLPVSTDTWTIDRPVSILYGLAQSAITLTAQLITERFTSAAKIGLLRRNASGYEEYNATELALSATTWTNRSSSNLIKQNFGSVQTTVNNYSSGVSAETGRPAVQLRGTHASNSVNLFGGDLGWGASDETATVATIRQEGGTLTVGANVTLTTLTKMSGTANVYCAATTITNNEGTLTHHAGAVTTVNVNGGTVYEKGAGTTTTVRATGGTYSTANTATVTTIENTGAAVTLLGPVTTVTNEAGSVIVDAGNVTTWTHSGGTGSYRGVGTITTMVISNGCTVDFSGGSAACTITTLTLGPGCFINDPGNRVVVTNAIVRTSGGKLGIVAP